MGFNKIYFKKCQLIRDFKPEYNYFSKVVSLKFVNYTTSEQLLLLRL